MLFTLILATAAIGFIGGGILWLARELRSLNKENPVPTFLYCVGIIMIATSGYQLGKLQQDAQASGANAVYEHHVAMKSVPKTILE